jgi:stage II sporulation protein AA (anti-sigma F factor antagonist)
MEMSMDLKLVADDGNVIRLSCEGDMSQADFQDNSLENLLGMDGLKRPILLNMERVRFLDSSGISWLLVRHKHIKEQGGKLVLHSLSPLVRQPLEFMNLTRVLHLAHDEPAARNLAGGSTT